MRAGPTFAAALALALSAASVQAHHFWLLPSATLLSKASYITVDAAVSNDHFYFNHRPLPVGEGLSVITPSGKRAEPENLMQGALRTVFDVRLAEPGTHRLELVGQGLMARWKDGDKARRFRGSPEDFARKVPAEAAELEVTEFASRLETFVTLGKPSPIKPTGRGLELAPLTHPNDLYAAETAGFRLLRDGLPAPGVEVTLIPDGSRYRDQLEEIRITTDAEGAFSVTWPGPGMYWLHAAISDDRAAFPQAKGRRFTYAATLEVMP